MADLKTQKMAQFYEQCQSKGYTDMRDDTQSLKAKVIAADLGLKYGKIEEFYGKAERAYQQVQAETERARLLQENARKQQEALAARRAVDGELLLTLSDSHVSSEQGTVLRVYLRPDKSLYTTINNGGKIEGSPRLEVTQGGVVQSAYHPSQLVYTGATVGGITTGGVHQTQASISNRVQDTGTGSIVATAGDRSIVVMRAGVSQLVRDAFRRDAAFLKLFGNGEMLCYNTAEAGSGGMASVYAQSAAHAADYGVRATMMSMAADKLRLPYEQCIARLQLLARIAGAAFPPTDEALYKQACALEQSERSADLGKAAAMFRSIADYRDAGERAAAIQQRYESTLQTEKEQAILEKERRSATIRKYAIRGGILAAALLALIYFVALPLWAHHRANQIASGDIALQEMYVHEEEDSLYTGYRVIRFDEDDPGQLAVGSFDDPDPFGISYGTQVEYEYKIEVRGGRVHLRFGDNDAVITGFSNGKVTCIRWDGSRFELPDDAFWARHS